jgi:hypothetical protein
MTLYRHMFRSTTPTKYRQAFSEKIICFEWQGSFTLKRVLGVFRSTLFLVAFLQISSFSALANTKPIASSATVYVNWETSQTIRLTASDVDGDPLTYEITTPPVEGELTVDLEEPNVFNYAPREGFSGRDKFTWKVNDGELDSYYAQVTIYVRNEAGNVPPLATSAQYTTYVDKMKYMVMTFSDPDPNQVKTFTILTPPSEGTLSPLYEYSGGVTNYHNYTPKLGFVGTDFYVWKLNDGISDSNIATNTITVNAAPVVTSTNNIPQVYAPSVTVVGGTSVEIPLYYWDSDSWQSLTHSILVGPTNGTFTDIGFRASYYYIDYHSKPGFVGKDIIVWKATDGTDWSNVATNIITVVANTPPNASATSESAFSGGRTKITCSFSDPDSGQTHVFSSTELPAHGKLEYFDTTTQTFKPVGLNAPLSTRTWYYTANTGYVGTDEFWFKVSDGVASDVAKVSITVKGNDYGKDWPMYRYDQSRVAESPLPLPNTLILQWTRQLPPLKPAWNSTFAKSSLTFDKGYEPVIMGKMMFVGSNRSDSVTAYDTDTGTEKWRFYAEGPVRLAPVAVNEKVYFVSDDGCLYCLDAATGAQLWKFDDRASRRLNFGNGRLISVWPARGGPVYYDGKIYFGSGVWPMEGTYFYAVDATTGNLIWKNDSVSAFNVKQPHAGPSVTGIMPQGHFAINGTGSKVIVPTGRSEPAFFNRTTGVMDSYITQGDKENPGTIPSVFVDWTANSRNTGFPVSIESGGMTYTTGPGVTEPVHTLLAADDKLFVVAKSGMIYCFGGNNIANPKNWNIPNVPLPVVDDQWTIAVANMLAQQGGVKDGCCLVWGIGTGRLVEELAKQTNFLIDVVDPDAAKVAALRKKLDDAGLYGSALASNGFYKPRVTIHVGSPASIEFPPYAARLICSQDINVAGFNSGISFVKKVFASLRPYGGTCWLPISSIQHGAFNSWALASSLSQAVVGRSGQFSLLTRSGKLIGSTDYVRPATGTSFLSADTVVKGPLVPQWYSDEYLFGGYAKQDYLAGPDIVDGLIISSTGKAYDVYTSLSIEGTRPYSGYKTIKSDGNNDDWIFGTRKNPFSGLDEPRRVLKLYGCGGESNYGNLISYRSGSAAYYDIQTESGTVNIGGIRPGCRSYGTIPANGILSVGAPPANHGCVCPYPVRTSLGMVHREDGQQYAPWGSDRSLRMIEEEPIRKLGINFGAPADYMAPDKTLWVGRPIQNGSTPVIPFTTVPSTTSTNLVSYIHNASWVNGSTWKSIARCGVKGLTSFSVNLAHPSVVALSSSAAPVIDGALDDSCWNGQSPIACNYTSGTVYFRYDANNLYAGFRYTGKMSEVGSLGGWSLFIGDRTNLDDKYVHLRVKKNGAIYDGLRNPGLRESETWSGVWSGKSIATTSDMTVEMSIPFATLAAVGLDTNNLIINIQNPGNGQLRGFRWVEGTKDWLEGTPVPAPCNQFNPLFFDTAKGDLGKTRLYTVRLYFADPDEIVAGARVFDIRLQGALKLANFDPVQAAGAPRTLVIKEFKGIQVKDNLVLDLVPKAGVTAIAGMEIVEETSVPNPDTNGDGIADQWQLDYFGSITSAQAQKDADPDGDGMNNESEYKAGTSPVNGSSRLVVNTSTLSAGSFQIQWQSVSGKIYDIQTSTNLTTWTTVDQVTASSTSATWIDSSPGSGKKFYRVKLH